MNLAQMSWSVLRYQYTRVHSQLLTTMLPVLRNKLCYYNRFYCCQRFPSSSSFQYLKSNNNNNVNNNVIAVERRRFLMSDEKTISPFNSISSVRGMAGHSKWQNIRHIKGAKDKEKSNMSMKFAHRINLAVKGKRTKTKYFWTKKMKVWTRTYAMITMYCLLS